MYIKVAWARVVRFIEFNIYSAKTILKGFDNTWGLGPFFANEMICKLHGIGGDNVELGGCYFAAWGFLRVLGGVVLG
jgi:hypothetical protein